MVTMGTVIGVASGIALVAILRLIKWDSHTVCKYTKMTAVLTWIGLSFVAMIVIPIAGQYFYTHGPGWLVNGVNSRTGAEQWNGVWIITILMVFCVAAASFVRSLFVFYNDK